MTKYKTPRWGWAITGSGHFLKETLAIVRELEDVDLFLSKAAAEVLRMYKQELALPRSIRVYRDTTASSWPVGQFYYGVYHTLIVAPATSNAVAKFVCGISDDLVSNVFNARIWGGLHFRNSEVVGGLLANEVVDYALTHDFQPLP